MTRSSAIFIGRLPRPAGSRDPEVRGKRLQADVAPPGRRYRSEGPCDQESGGILLLLGFTRLTELPPVHGDKEQKTKS